MKCTGLGVIFLTLLAESGCGALHWGGGPVNETLPSTAVPIVSGSFVGLNGQSASGTATVYFNGGNNYITRLEGVSLPSVVGLQVITVGSTGTIDTESLAFTSGNQNYYFTVNGTQPTFNQVNIYAPAANLNYAQANLY